MLEGGAMTPGDLQRIHASPTWRTHRIEVFHGTSVGSVLVKGQRPARPAWRYQLLNGFARAAGLPLLRAAPALGGAQAQQIEVERLRSLQSAGVAVPEVLHVETDFFVQRWLGETRLDALLQHADSEALHWWTIGLRTLIDLHARGQYLSQAFARNFIACGDTLAMIDFEDDPLQVMSLDQAQARDWLAYLHSSARALSGRQFQEAEAPAALLRHELANEREPVRQMVAETAQRLAWVLHLPAHRGGRGWRRHVSILQSVLRLALGAATGHNDSTMTSEALHARHH
jgi:tRNA A-37 threonylcarbamoyl transferase component Bud32